MVKSKGEKRNLDSEDEGEVTEERVPKRFNTGKEPLLKLLVPHYAAGALIGKGGSLMTVIQEQFGCHMHLSASSEFYPGTEERIVVLTGELNEIIDLNKHIMDKVTGDPGKDIDGRGRIVKIVLTNTAAGLLIGRGGLTIKGIQEESKAKISISSVDVAAVPGERVLTMSGNLNERVEGCRLVIEKIAEEPSNMANTATKYQSLRKSGGSSSNIGYSNMAQNEDLFSMLSETVLSRLRGTPSISNVANKKDKLNTKVEVMMEIPDNLVGGMLGKQGTSIRELAIKSGARFKFSDKDDFVEGTTDRILSITGDMNQAYAAYHLVQDKVEQLNNQLGTAR